MKEVKKRLMTQEEYNAFVDKKLKGKKNKNPADILIDLINELKDIEIVVKEGNE